MPEVSVLMSVYNGERYLREAIDSILSQTFQNFEFIIINDGSIDGTNQILESYNDPRIIIIHQENIGLSKSLNKGLRLSCGEFIARMDCDDISLPQRLEKQLLLMDREPEIGVCGTWIKTIGSDSEEVWNYPASPHEIRCRLIFESVIAHPSVMLRRSLFEEFNLTYDEKFNQAQDYDLWVRSSEVFPLRNIDEVLLLYRIHPEQGGIRHADTKRQLANVIRTGQLSKLGIVPHEEEFKIHEKISYYEFEADQDFIINAHSWLIKLYNKNRELNYYDFDSFRKLLAIRWYLACENASALGLTIWKLFSQSPLSKSPNISWLKRFKLFVKCMINYSHNEL